MKKTLLLAVFTVLIVAFSTMGLANLNIDDCNLDWGSDDDACSGADLPPDSNIDMEITVENNYADDLEDVYVEVIIYDFEDEGDDDLEEESDEEDIDSGDDEKFDISFDVPLKIDSENDYEMVVFIYGEFSNGTKVKYNESYSVGIDKEKHDVIFTRATLFPEKITCKGTSTLDVKIYNFGESDEDDVEIELKNSELDILQKRTGIDLDEDPYDEDAEYSTSFSINIDGAETGSYPLYLTATYDDGDKTANEQVNLIIEACEPIVIDEPEEEQEPEEVVIVTPTPVTPTPEEVPDTTVTVPPEIVVATQQPEKDNFLTFVIVLEILIVIVGIVVAIAWLKKK